MTDKKTSCIRRKKWLLLLPAVLAIAILCAFALHRYTSGPLILVFDVNGKLLLRNRRIFACHDYPIEYRHGSWFIRRPDNIARKYIKKPLTKTTQIYAPYKTRVLDDWYYVLEPDGRIMACRGDSLQTQEIRYVNDMWSVQVDGEWISAFDDY